MSGCYDPTVSCFLRSRFDFPLGDGDIYCGHTQCKDKCNHTGGYANCPRILEETMDVPLNPPLQNIIKLKNVNAIYFKATFKRCLEYLDQKENLSSYGKKNVMTHADAMKDLKLLLGEIQ